MTGNFKLSHCRVIPSGEATVSPNSIGWPAARTRRSLARFCAAVSGGKRSSSVRFAWPLRLIPYRRSIGALA